MRAPCLFALCALFGCMDYDLGRPPDVGEVVGSWDTADPEGEWGDSDESEDDGSGLGIGIGELEHRWLGEYTCTQGLTAFELVIELDDSDDLRAVFSFWAHEYNPGVPTGSFWMQGYFDSGTGHLYLEQDFWIEQPDGYVMVDLDGFYLPSSQTIEGDIIPQGSCTTFYLERQVE